MIQIREGIFETNSSSTHSISLGDGFEMSIDTSWCPDRDGVIKVDGHEFGWDQETYNEAEYKVSYAWIIVRDWSEDEKEKRHELLDAVIMAQTGATEVWYEPKEGYIDHQSVDCDQMGWLFEDVDTLRNFIFNRDSWLETDNDNYQ